jgi:hypothetical protein
VLRLVDRYRESGEDVERLVRDLSDLARIPGEEN